MDHRELLIMCGKLTKPIPDAVNLERQSVKCECCNGTGAVTCYECDGKGFFDEEVEIGVFPYPPSTAAKITSPAEMREVVQRDWSATS